MELHAYAAKRDAWNRYYDITDTSFDINNYFPKKQTKDDSTQFELVQDYFRPSGLV